MSDEHPLSAMNEFFGHFPARPDHPDLWRISNVVLKQDSGIDPERNTEEQNEAAWNAVIDEVGIDKASLLYVANQRAMRALGITSPVEILGSVHELALLTGLWVDAFCAGVLTERGDQ